MGKLDEMKKEHSGSKLKLKTSDGKKPQQCDDHVEEEEEAEEVICCQTVVVCASMLHNLLQGIATYYTLSQDDNTIVFSASHWSMWVRSNAWWSLSTWLHTHLPDTMAALTGGPRNNSGCGSH